MLLSILTINNKTPPGNEARFLCAGLTPLASTRGFEPPTPRLGGVCSIQLSYVDIYKKFNSKQCKDF